MDIDPYLLSPAVLLALRILAAVALLLALAVAPWRQLVTVPARQHLLCIVALSLAVLWLETFRPADGISLHLLGMSAATLVLGGALATLAGLLALLFLAAVGKVQPGAIPITWLLTAVVPALVTTSLSRLLAWHGHRNLFMFLLGLGFFGAMVSLLTVAAAGLAVLALGGQPALVADALDHAALLPLLLFPEGFVNGAATTTLTVYFPELVRSFDEDHFLRES